MTRKVIPIFLVAVLVITLFGAYPVFGQAYNTTFITSITYQNVDTIDADIISILFYPDPDSTTPIEIIRPTLKAGAGTSLYIGTLDEIDEGFQGSAIMQSNAALVATLVQVPQSTTVLNRPLSNGFQMGSPQVLLATVLKNQYNYNSLFSVQNTDTEANTITIDFYNTSASKVHTIIEDLEPGASFFVDASLVTALGDSFNGSAVVNAKRSSDADGNIVATVMELQTNGNGAAAFESVATGDRTFYMSSALCNYVGGYNSAYAVQNTDLTNSTSVKVTYSNGAEETKTIGPGAKQSFIACDASDPMEDGFLGAAILESSSTDVIAIGKVYGFGTSTAFLGASSGSSRLALPYVRWSQSLFDSGLRQRAFLAIQNVGTGEIPENALSVKYYDKNGTLLATHTFDESIAVGAKVNSNPFWNKDPDMAEFGYYEDKTFGGSAVVECTSPGCEVVAIARIQSKVPTTLETVGEDYNGIIIP